MDTHGYVDMHIPIPIYTRANQNVGTRDCHIWVAFPYLGTGLSTVCVFVREELTADRDRGRKSFPNERGSNPLPIAGPFL